MMHCYKVYKITEEYNRKDDDDDWHNFIRNMMVMIKNVVIQVLYNRVFYEHDVINLKKLLQCELASRGLSVDVLPIGAGVIRGGVSLDVWKIYFSGLHGLYFFTQKVDLTLQQMAAFEVSKSFVNKPSAVRTEQLKSLPLPKALIAEIEKYL